MEPTVIIVHLLITMARHIPWWGLPVLHSSIIPTRTTSPLSSTPVDWHKVGTEYLFVNDKLHSYGRSMFSFGFDEASGKHINGAYKNYVIEKFALWFQVYDHTYGENLLEKYPAAKKALMSEIMGITA